VSVDLGDLRWPELVERSGDTVLVVPVGATEQHGPHLPFSTDTDIACAIAEQLARAQTGTVVAPALPYGSSGEHSAFLGTISIGHRATELLLVELVRSATASFQRIVLVSTHGGNAEAVERAARRLHDEGHDVLVWSPRWRGDAHAGRAETSIMLALRPEAVRLGHAEAGNTGSLDELWPVLRSAGVAAVSPNGVLGDPTGASSDEGRWLLATAVDELREAIKQWTKSR
jgi:mycofactocin precursor peptide peptidase